MEVGARKVLTAVTVNTIVVAGIAALVSRGALRGRFVPLISFCLFWGNYIFFAAAATPFRGGRGGPSRGLRWQFLAALAGAGIYFAGALWGIIMYLRDRDWIALLGTVFAGMVGAYCIRLSRRIRGRLS